MNINNKIRPDCFQSRKKLKIVKKKMSWYLRNLAQIVLIDSAELKGQIVFKSEKTSNCRKGGAFLKKLLPKN